MGPVPQLVRTTPGALGRGPGGVRFPPQDGHRRAVPLMRGQENTALLTAELTAGVIFRSWPGSLSGLGLGWDSRPNRGRSSRIIEGHASGLVWTNAEDPIQLGPLRKWIGLARGDAAAEGLAQAIDDRPAATADRLLVHGRAAPLRTQRPTGPTVPSGNRFRFGIAPDPEQQFLSRELPGWTRQGCV
jgi:hypothetical protein